MEKEFVPYELAVKLKAIGFDEECFGYYDLNNKPIFFGFDGLMDTHCVQVNRPTFSQAFRWFREEYCMPSYIKPILVIDTPISYQFCIEDDTIDFWFEKYAEAELACLTKLIEIVETRTK